ncbi:hypothetical protein B0A48_14055 [Cryoendolithus antarcticus]|uniref:Gem-associated protein 5 TPR domain-containing protein n=1 Tax=Cryoendolithus antarcticus TaxID=1507870 RepID=A0A1V8SMM8_9PEZI|nr:hypothetical protein B0A48_14055 [Cryoendolithus antarcticus]
MRHTPPPNALTPENHEQEFEPLAATGSYMLYAQRSTILVLHHDTLTIERRFELHKEEVKWIVVDNVSERGAGRLAVSYDTGNTCIVWDIFTGGEVARFTAFDEIVVATFMRNGNIALGNVAGSITLFEPSTAENLSTRTIFDPITALAPSVDCRSFAIGYLNGSILIATLQPAFTILHTLTTSRAPSRITGLAWHGSSSKQKTDMLATQTLHGDLRVWSVPKAPYQEAPSVIRVLSRPEFQQPAPCWFAWSKNGRLVQHVEGETRSWDVRTKKVTYEVIPTIDGIVGIGNYGPTASLFTLGRNHTVQQYDITPGNPPMQVQHVQHAPANTPPTPPTVLEEDKNPYRDPQTAVSTEAPLLPVFTDSASSADESAAMSPLEKIATEMDSLDAMESELRDKVMPLSPTSSRASSVSSRSSGGGRRQRKYLYDKPSSSRASSNSGYDGTEFSFGGPSVRNHDSMSIRSGSTRASNTRFRTSALRKEVLRSPEEVSKDSAVLDLLPYVRARLREVAFRTPHYGSLARTPEVLQREMLSIVFGWNDDITSLVRDELSRQRPGTASAVLLTKWLGETGPDSMASMMGTESMTSSDWMLLALSSIGADSQKKVGEAFVQRLLEKGDIHPASAILLGLGEFNDAIEIYVTQGYFMEAVILTCLNFPSDWKRQSYLLRKWGEVAVQEGEPELAVRIFSCTSVETSEPWFSPRAQDAVYAAQQQRMMEPLSATSMASPPLSPPSRSGSGRLAAKNASLKLITTFGARGAPMSTAGSDPMSLAAAAATPIAESALSPRGAEAGWLKVGGKMVRDPSSARTATPGGFARRKRLPSRSEAERTQADGSEYEAPVTAARDTASRTSSALGHHSRRTSSVSSVPEPATALKPTTYRPDKLGVHKNADASLPSPSQGAFNRLRANSHQRNSSHDKKPDGLSVQILETRYAAEALSPGPSTHDTTDTGYTAATEDSRGGVLSPPLTGLSLKSAKTKAIDDYINSVEAARDVKRQERAGSRARAESRRRGENHSRNRSRAGRGDSRVRDRSVASGRDGPRYIKPAKRSPSSPVPMSPAEIAHASFQEGKHASGEEENFYKLTSPVESQKSGKSGAFAEAAKSAELPPRSASRTGRRQRSPDGSRLQVDNDRGRSDSRGTGSAARSPSSPLPVLPNTQFKPDDDTQSDGRRIRFRSQSGARKEGGDLQVRRAASRSNMRDRSMSRRPKPKSGEDQLGDLPFSLAPDAQRRPRDLTRKELAAKELEDRRLSLARRPSAPTIPLPLSTPNSRPNMSPRSHTELGDSPNSYMPPLSRSHTVDPDAMMRHKRLTGTSTPSAPIGLPATPRAMRHPRYMSSDPNDLDAPPVPGIPGNLSSLSGSSLSQVTGSNLSQAALSSLGQITGSTFSQAAPSSLSQVSSSMGFQVAEDQDEDSIGPLLPSTVFGMRGPQGPSRSASAPPEKMMGLPVHPAYKSDLPSTSRRLSGGLGHIRKISPPDAIPQVVQPEITSIDSALQQQIIIVPDDEEDSGPAIMLPELQHLMGPPPPPPPPTMYQQLQHNDGGMIINIDSNELTGGPEPETTLPAMTFPVPMERASTTSPSLTRNHRAGQNSVSETFGSRMRGVADRMRSNSRSRAKSPPMPDAYTYRQPYETVLPPVPTQHQRRGSLSSARSLNRAKSPYEQAMADQQNAVPPPPPPPPAPPAMGMDMKFSETVVPPRSQSAMGGAGGGYRHPKEIRANMPPSSIQAGAYESRQGGFL